MRKTALLLALMLFIPALCCAANPTYFATAPTAVTVTALSDDVDDDLKVEFKFYGASSGAARGPIAITTTATEGVITGFKFCSASTDFDVDILGATTDTTYSNGALIRCAEIDRAYSVDKTSIQKQFIDADGIFHAYINDDASVATPTITGYFYIKKSK